MRRQILSVQTVTAQHTASVILQIEDSLVKLTAQQARHLASLLVVQAHAVALMRTESADSFRIGSRQIRFVLVDGSPNRLVSVGRAQESLIACRASKVVLREPNQSDACKEPDCR
jgi:hypothetical protein